MSYLLPNYARQKIEFIKGEGSYLWDTQGNRYLDFTCGIGVQNLGHRPQHVQAAIQNQLEKEWHLSNLYESTPQAEVAALLCEPYDFRAYFCNSGAEANEAALKIVRKASGKTKIVSFKDSFHGRTYGAMTATGQEKIQTGFGPLVPDFEYLTYNNLEDLEKLDDFVAAVMLEMVQGEGGVIPAQQEWVKALTATCHDKGILIIVDEIQTGIGRTGSFFAFEQYDFIPDIVTLAKALSSGIPVGAMLAKSQYADAFGPGSHGTTFGGNLLAMAAAKEVVTTVQKEAFQKQLTETVQAFWKELETLAVLPTVKAIRGLGLMIGIQVDAEKIPEIIQNCQNQGLLVLRAGKDVIRLLPPLTVTKEEIMEGIAILEKALKD